MQYISIELVHMAKLIYKNTTEIMMLLYSGQFFYVQNIRFVLL